MEYEYSFKVKDIIEYINYLENNNYVFISESKQTRTLYRNKEKKMLARVTIDEVNGSIIKKLDFKEDKLSSDDLIVRRETDPIEFINNPNMDDILEYLGFVKDTTLIRTRIIYEKNNVKFEIDKYESPYTDNVIALEGKKEDVDLEYNNLSELNKKLHL